MLQFSPEGQYEGCLRLAIDIEVLHTHCIWASGRAQMSRQSVPNRRIFESVPNPAN